MKKQLLLAYASQAYSSIIGIVLMPIYLRHLGTEAFGLIGFFLMAQAWMQVLDMGLSPVLSREMSRYRAGTISLCKAAGHLNTMEWLQRAIAAVIMASTWLLSTQIAERWLLGQALSPTTISTCVTLMGGAIVLRWLAGLYRGVLAGLEQQNHASTLAAIFSTLRFAGVVPILLYVSNSPEYFFAFQLGISALELVASATLTRRFIPGKFSPTPRLEALSAMLPMAGGMAFLSAMWILLTQIDKLVLSTVLNLREYGHFSLAIVAASGVLIIVPPLNQVVQPRLTILIEQGANKAFEALYSMVSQLSTVVFVSLGAGIGLYSETLLRVWTGSDEIAVATAPILLWYGLANAVVGVLVTPFMLQFAIGNLKLHIIGNLIMLISLVPALVVSAQHWGATGAAQVFFGANLLFLLLWLPFVHHRFLPNLTWHWLFLDTLPVAFVVFSTVGMMKYLIPNSLPPSVALTLGFTSVLLACLLGLLTGGHSRRLLLRELKLGRAQ